MFISKNSAKDKPGQIHNSVVFVRKTPQSNMVTLLYHWRRDGILTDISIKDEDISELLRV